MRVHVCHGIHTPEDDHVVLGLVPYLQAAGLTVLFPDYSWIGGLETRRLNPLIEGIIRPYIEPGDIWIGHSNGCCIGYHLMSAGAPLAGAIFINAALERQITRPAHVQYIDVLFNQGDTITEVAQIAARLGLVDHFYGEMGHAGYEGADAAITSFDCGLTVGMPVVSGHSDIFTPSKLAEWGPWIAQRILSRVLG